MDLSWRRRWWGRASERLLRGGKCSPGKGHWKGEVKGTDSRSVPRRVAWPWWGGLGTQTTGSPQSLPTSLPSRGTVTPGSVGDTGFCSSGRGCRWVWVTCTGIRGGGAL